MPEHYDFLLHPGFGKTGTTYVQRILSQEPGVLYLGKDHKELHLTPELQALHCRLFPLCDLYGSKEPSACLRNSRAPSIEYAKCIAGIVKEKKLRQLILSDEAIFGFGIYNAELNVLLAARLIRDIERELNATLKVKVLLTIREQASMLQSHYAYDYLRWARMAKTPEKLVELLMNEGERNAKFASLRFDEVLEFMDATLLGGDVQILPLELLVSDPDAYHTSLASLLGKNALAAEPPGTMVNSNRRQEAGVVKNVIKKPTLLSRVKSGAFVAALPVYQRVRGRLPAGVKDILRKLWGRYGSIEFVDDRSQALAFAFTDEQNARVRAYFAPGNRKLQGRTSFDLKTLGYGVET